LKKIIIAVCSAVALLFAFASPAAAHTEKLWQGLDEAWVTEGYTCEPGSDGYCRNYHRKVIVTDHECDGEATGAIWRTGDDSLYFALDRDGCSGDGATFNHDTHQGRKNVHEFRLCEAANNTAFENGNYTGCTAWRDVDPLYHPTYAV
jgi:hypothetical protein